MEFFFMPPVCLLLAECLPDVLSIDLNSALHAALVIYKIYGIVFQK